MARQPRFVLPGHPQHVIQRGNNRQPTFFADEDYRFYLNRLKGRGATLSLRSPCLCADDQPHSFDCNSLKNKSLFLFNVKYF